MTTYTRRLPHVRVEGAIYFVTWRVRTEQPHLTEDERDCVAGAIGHFNAPRCDLDAYVVMNDHVHVLVEPHPVWRLEHLFRSWKSFTANRMQCANGRMGAIWQDEYFDRVVRDDAEYREKVEYILHNPFKRWPEIDSYRWCWALGVD